MKPFLENVKRNQIKVEVDAWGNKVVVFQQASANEIKDHHALQRRIEKKDPNNGHIEFMGQTIVRFALDEEGNRLFEDDDFNDVMNQPFGVLDFLTGIYLKVNGLGGDEDDKSTAA